MYKPKFLVEIDKLFPESRINENIRRLEYCYCKSLYVKSKFSGGDILAKYGITGSYLGKIIGDFKLHIINTYPLIYDGFDDYILSNSRENILKEFEIFYSTYKKDSL